MHKHKRALLYKNKEHFISSWLSADPSDLRSARSAELDMDKLLKTLLEALAEEESGVKEGKVIRLADRAV